MREKVLYRGIPESLCHSFDLYIDEYFDAMMKVKILKDNGSECKNCKHLSLSTVSCNVTELGSKTKLTLERLQGFVCSEHSDLEWLLDAICKD